jgi:uncharacterized protein YacL
MYFLIFFTVVSGIISSYFIYTAKAENIFNNIEVFSYSLTIFLLVLVLIKFFRRKKSFKTRILDTSCLIDGRILELCAMQLISGVLIIPRIVINDLKRMKSSQDSIDRAKAEKALDIINSLKGMSHLDIKISNKDFKKNHNHLEKIVKIARYYNAQIITADFNILQFINKYKVNVLNIFDIAGAVKAIKIPGERLHLYLFKRGKKNDEALSYMEDNTLVIVEDSKQFIGRRVEVVITGVRLHANRQIVFCKLIGPLEE